MIDYLGSSHRSPIILPGQAVQEFWNNQLAVFDTMEGAIKKDAEKLVKNLGGLGTEFRETTEMFTKALDHLSDEHTATYSSATITSMLSLLEMLSTKAIVPFCTRSIFHTIAAERKRSKTPPGFKDQGDGDFYVWVETMCGLLMAKRRRIPFDSFVLVTNDKKDDWSRQGIPHPILSAEVLALVGVPFHIWPLEKLALEVSKV